MARVSAAAGRLLRTRIGRCSSPCSETAPFRFVLSRFYSQAVHDHFKNPRNVGSFDSKDPSVGTAVVGKAACGDVIKLQVRVRDDVIEDVRFKAFGCGSAIASSSFASELIKGKTTAEALRVKNIDIANHLSLPPVKVHCSLLAEDAIKHAIKDYTSKQDDITEESVTRLSPSAPPLAVPGV